MPNGQVWDLAVYGNTLYAVGVFGQAGGQTVNHVAKWNGTAWTSMGGGTNNWNQAVAVDGQGRVYVGGLFTTAGSVPANHIAMWADGQWSALGTGLDVEVHAIKVDQSGNVYAAGPFTMAGGVSVNRIAKWDGFQWTALGSGLTGAYYPYFSPSVEAISFSQGDVYVGGDFMSAGGKASACFAHYDVLSLETYLPLVSR
jgi:hypothetical protein